jgi:hypothetical protein
MIVKKTLLPSPAALSTHILPPIRETRYFEMESPRSTPPDPFREKSGLLAEEQMYEGVRTLIVEQSASAKASEMKFNLFWATPIPLSETQTSRVTAD